jgi:DnaJ-class molecular chaperone
MYVRVEVAVPTRLTANQRKLIKDLEGVLDFNPRKKFEG